MSSNNNSIHDFDFNLICEYYSTVERQGPGSPEVTIKALGFIDNLTDSSKIADLGCGREVRREVRRWCWHRTQHRSCF